MKLYDTFMYNGEADVLECRLYELYDLVDLFVIVEADTTHGGGYKKPYHFMETTHRFMSWYDKIMYIMVKDLPNDPDPWQRENTQRDCILRGLNTAEAEDIIMISDVDEIPKAECIELIASEGMTLFHQTLYAMNLNWYDSTPWWGTVAIPFGEMITPQHTRDHRRYAQTKLDRAGWHISWMGDDDAREKKLLTSSHEKSDFPEWSWSTETGRFLGSQLRPTSYNNTYPKWITDGKAPASWFADNEGK